MRAITSFTGEHAFLSNFFPAHVTFEGAAYRTVEHAYQAAKTNDPEEREMIQRIRSPGGAKRLGKILTLTDNWENLRESVMRGLLVQKFVCPGPLFSKLEETAPADLIEGNTWGDTFWGVCEGSGQNKLGLMLMEIRDRS